MNFIALTPLSDAGFARFSPKDEWHAWRPTLVDNIFVETVETSGFR
jgi:hypothetical protein